MTVVDVAQGSFEDVTLPGIVTDLDLSADASDGGRDHSGSRSVPAGHIWCGAGAGAGGESGAVTTAGGVSAGGRGRRCRKTAVGREGFDIGAVGGGRGRRITAGGPF